MADTILEVRHLMKQFDDLIVLKDINLTVHEGEVIVIVGPSGCGKSTFLRCINALEDIQGGEIRLNGELVSKESKNTVKYKPNAAFGLLILFASMICWATFRTSTTPIIRIRLVVLIIRVIRLIDRGISLRTVYGSTTY